MIDVAKSVPVNRNLEPGEPILSAPDIWRGLVMKAENPMPFVTPITACTILERTANGLVREIVHKGETLRERITYDVGRSVTFVRETGTVEGIVPTPRSGGKNRSIVHRNPIVRLVARYSEMDPVAVGMTVVSATSAKPASTISLGKMPSALG
jgi:Acetylaranotin biosynthesis cluster protein L